MPLIHIAEWPHPIEAGRHRILEAALDAGVPFPHDCGAGECGTCKCELLEGEVLSDRNGPDALSAEERDAGLILACRSRPVGDVAIRWLATERTRSMVKIDATVSSIARVAHDVIVLTLQLPHAQRFDFRPGQFAKLRFGRLPARSYSMANSPGEDRLVFHVRVLPEGLVSTKIANGLRVGETVEVRGPFGEAYWEGVQSPALLLLAGGTGLAPILSVLDAALREGQPADRIHVYHGVRAQADLYGANLLERRVRERGIHFVPVFSGEQPNRARYGLLHEAVAQDFADLADTTIHVAGPPAMVDAVVALARERRAASERVRADAFYPAEPAKRSLWERITAWGGLE